MIKKEKNLGKLRCQVFWKYTNELEILRVIPKGVQNEQFKRRL